MWLTERIKPARRLASRMGRITRCGQGLCASAAGEHRQIPLMLPPGYSCVPAQGDPVVLLSTADGMVCGGRKTDAAGLKSGQITIQSPSGARIVLMENGEIVLNGVRVLPEGTILAKEYRTAGEEAEKAD